MYTIIGTVTARPQTRVELQDLLLAQVVPTRAEAGCINYDFHVDAADPCIFVFYENWTSRAALDAHLAMPHLQPLFSQLDRLLAVPVDIRPLTMLSLPVERQVGQLCTGPDARRQNRSLL